MPTTGTETSSPLRRFWYLLGIGSFVLAAFSFLTALLTKQDERVVSPQFSSSPSAESATVAARAWLDSNQVPPGKPFSIEFEFENRTDKDVTQFELETLPTGLLLRLDGWDERTASGWAPLRGRPASPALKAGASAHYRCRLTPGEIKGPFSISAVFGYSRNGVRSHNAISVGPLRVVDESWERILSVAASLQTVITALLFPAALGILAWLVPELEKQRTARKEKADSEAAERKEEQEHRAAESRAQAQQTWNLLLPQSMQNAREYYLPAASAVLRMSMTLDRPRPPADPARAEYRREVVFYLLMFLRLMRDTRDRIGGFHFKHRKGEWAASICWVSLLRLVLVRFTLREYDAALDAVDPKHSFDQFSKRLEWLPALRRAEQIITAWMDGTGAPALSGYLPLFNFYRQVVRYEVNRPLEHWYNAPESSEDLCQSWEKLKGIRYPEIAGWGDTVHDLAAYVTGVVCAGKA